MMFKKSSAHGKKENPTNQAESAGSECFLTPQEVQQLATEISFGIGMMLPGSFPDGIWHLY